MLVQDHVEEVRLGQPKTKQNTVIKPSEDKTPA